MPVRFRVDNGWPWGSRGDFPTELALWMIGLGIGMHWNNPHRPQENGVVERRFYSMSPPRAEYVLTAKGRELGPIVGAMRDWGRKYGR